MIKSPPAPPARMGGGRGAAAAAEAKGLCALYFESEFACRPRCVCAKPPRARGESVCRLIFTSASCAVANFGPCFCSGRRALASSFNSRARC